MTTNVLDLQHDIATSDSRWSILLSSDIVYVDDTGFDKIFECNGYILVFAGTANLIQIWKNHISNPDASGMPPTEANGMAIAVSITDRSTGNVIFEHRQASIYESVRFAGSGATYAEQCWFRNFCSKKAVETASIYDVCTGGQVKFFSFNGDHNVDLSTTTKAISEAMQKRGMIMYSNRSNKATPIAEAIKTDSRLGSLIDDLSTGKESMCAPFPGMHQPMSNTEKRMLEKAIFKIKQPR